MCDPVRIQKPHGESKIDGIECDETRRRLIKAAVVEHYRWFPNFDAYALDRVRGNIKGLMPPELAAVIATEYKVSRCLNLGENGKLHQSERSRDQTRRHKKFAKILNRARTKWPITLKGRARRCSRLAQDIVSEGLSSDAGYPASAATKLMWFVEPEDWTVFDNVASKALLRSPSKGNSIEKMERFYCELGNRCFVNDAKDIQANIEDSEFKFLHGTRVIDKFLLFVGAEDEGRNRSLDQCDTFVRYLPNCASEPLDELADCIADHCGENLLKRHEKRGAV